MSMIEKQMINVTNHIPHILTRDNRDNNLQQPTSVRDICLFVLCYGEMWCSVVRCGAVWCGVVWNGARLCGLCDVVGCRVVHKKSK